VGHVSAWSKRQPVATCLCGTSLRRKLTQRAAQYRRYHNSARALNVTVTTSITSCHMNSSNEARCVRIGAVPMLVCPMDCYAVCTGKRVLTSARHRDISKRWGRYQSIRRKVLCAFRKATIRYVTPVRQSVRLSAWNNGAPTGEIFIKFDIWAFFETQ